MFYRYFFGEGSVPDKKNIPIRVLKCIYRNKQVNINVRRLEEQANICPTHRFMFQSLSFSYFFNQPIGIFSHSILTFVDFCYDIVSSISATSNIKDNIENLTAN